MSENIVTLTLGGRELKLIGTAHVSRESCEEVKKIINEDKPDMVCVELDQGRYNSLMQNDNWEKLNLSKVFKERKGFLLIANLVLSSFQRRLGNDLGIKPGEEMKTAIETAKELEIPFSLCDREVHTTLRRAWASCNFWNKTKLLASLLASAFTTEKLSEEEIENLKKRNELEGMMNELAEYLPPVKTVLIDERDRYLASKIWTSTLKGKRSVAIVGAGHMQGMVSHLEKLAGGDITPDVSELELIPPRGFFAKASRFIIPAVIITLVTTGFITSGRDAGFSMMLQWLLWNGSLAAIGATIALAHPLAILVSFIGAPITSLTPFIGVGIVSGLVQVTMCKPRVCDAEEISASAAAGIKGWYRNRITRALLVFFLSSLGSSIGTFFAIPAIVNLMGN